MNVNILGTDYKVIFNGTEKNIYGYCDKIKKEIAINLNLSDNEIEFKDTLIHELIHAFCWESGILLDYGSNEEFLANWIAKHYFKIFKAYEEITKLLVEWEEQK